MDNKIEELLNAIDFPREEYSSFLNVSLKKVKVSKNKMHIIIKSTTPLELDIYLKLLELLKAFFKTECILEVETDKKSYEGIRECYLYATENIESTFIRDRLKNNYNSYYIELNNEINHGGP